MMNFTFFKKNSLFGFISFFVSSDIWGMKIVLVAVSKGIQAVKLCPQQNPPVLN